MGPEADIASTAVQSRNLWPVVLYALGVGVVVVASIGGSWLLGARTRRRKATDMPFESGIVSVGTAEQTRLSIEFYLVAMLFVIFDLETIFIFAWAVAFFELGWHGYLGVSAFIVVLLVALVYEWRVGALDWGLKHRQKRGRYAVEASVGAAQGTAA